MPARTDISSVLIIGSGPIVIGQACEFDYSGVQACRVLQEEGYRVILANSNPATIMTDPGFADATYVEPLVPEVIEAVIARERPDALLPTIGGQTALNLAKDLADSGALERYGTELIGASMEAIATAEDREQFKEAMVGIGLSVPASGIARSMEEGRSVAKQLGLPVIIRPAYILGGRGATIAEEPAEFEAALAEGLAASPIGEVLIEESIVGWKEFELEVMRDRADNCVVVCSIENFDPMGVHTGDSITVAPAQTLSDMEYQAMRDSAFACMRRVGVETGGSNVQFAVNPHDGRQVVIEMNPRVSRSSALASKATGFPIAKIAARLAVGYTLDEIPNDITRATPACFEPTIDYVVTKIPRWSFEKFPSTPPVLGAAMQSVGEVMALGRTFPESLQKAVRSLEQGRFGLNCDAGEAVWAEHSAEELLEAMRLPTPDRIYQIEAALRKGASVENIHEATFIDPWFIDQMLAITEERKRLKELKPGANGSAANSSDSAGADASSAGLTTLSSAAKTGEASKDGKSAMPELVTADWRRARQLGFSDEQLGWLWGVSAEEVASARRDGGIEPVYKTVDTCGAEFEALTPYHYSTCEDADEVLPSELPKVIILGAGPNRIGQGIEFDYCCVHASMALREAGYATVMLNCNPETVSTDYDTSDRLFFEPLTSEDVLAVIAAEERVAKATGTPGVEAVIIGLGGQTPLKLAHDLPRELIAGTSPDAVDIAEDRKRWADLCRSEGIPQPPGGTATAKSEAFAAAEGIGFPLLVRPSYVLGGRAMVLAYDRETLAEAMEEIERSLGREGGLSAERPVLLDRFLEDAIEVDVDAVRDKDGEVLIGGIMEHVEAAGVHSGDSACVLPPRSLSEECLATMRDYTARIASALDVRGPLNVQYAVARGSGNETDKAGGEADAKADTDSSFHSPISFGVSSSGETDAKADTDSGVYVIEANPRASRTVPFVAKATGVPLAKIAARVMLGDTLAELRSEGMLASEPSRLDHVAVKEAVLPFNRFPETDTLLGPEMRSTGEVMGIDASFGRAFMKSQLAAGSHLPLEGTVLLCLPGQSAEAAKEIAKSFSDLGFEILTDSVSPASPSIAANLNNTAGPSITANLSNAANPIDTTNPSDATNPIDPASLLQDNAVSLAVIAASSDSRDENTADLRRLASRKGIPMLTTLAATRAAIEAIQEWQQHPLTVRPLQEYNRP